MKQVMAIALMLLASSGTARVAVLCARLLCPKPVAVCCCQGMGHPGKRIITMPMSCDGPASAPQAPKLKMMQTECCTVSSLPQEQATAVLPNLSTGTLGSDHEGQAQATVHILPEPPPGLMAFSQTTAIPCLDRSDTYLITTTFRI